MTTSFTRGENPLRADKLNQAFSERLNRQGDTMQGMLTLWRDPVNPFDAATKQYIDRNSIPPISVSDTPPNSPPNGSLWFDSVGQQLYVRYNDPNSVQWVPATNVAALAGGGPFLPLSGGTVTGATTFNAGLTSQYPGTANRLTSTPTHPSATYVPGSSQLFSYYVAASGGGNRFDVVANSQFYSSITGAPDTFVFNNLNVVDYAGSGGQSQLVATYNQAIRRTRNAGGVPNNPEIFGAVFEAIDFTNSDSAASNGMSGVEIDMTCGNTDSAHNRRGFGMYLNRANGGDVAPVVSLGMHLAANAGSYDTVLKIETPFNIAAIDLRSALATVGTAHQIWLGTAGTIALDTPASFTLSGDTTGGMVLAAAAGQPARIIYQSARTWWSGAWSDGSFYITDQTGTANRITITPAGAITLNGAATITAGLILNGSVPQFRLSAAAGVYRAVQWETSGSARWAWVCSADAETGGNIGSNFYLGRYDDTGTPVGSPPISVDRPSGAVTMNNGANFGAQVGASNTDMSKHIALHTVGYGFAITANRQNYIVPGPAAHVFLTGTSDRLSITATGLGFNGTAAVAKPTGWGAATGTATRSTFVTGSVTLPVLAEHVKALIDDMIAYGLI
jgi:hypothetical protein